MNSLPDEIVTKIFEQLSAPERVRLERVSKKWQSLSLRSWTKYRCLQDDFYLYERRIDVWKKEFKILAIPTEETRIDILKKMLFRCGKYVTSFDMKNNLSRNILFLIARLCPNLEDVRCSEVSLTKSSINRLTLYCSKLKVVKFDGCFSYGINVDRELSNLFRNCIHFVSLELTMATLTGRCFCCLPTEIKSLTVAYCNELESGAFRNLADRCSRLEVLKINHCNQITMESLAYVFRKLADLRVFHFSCDAFENAEGMQLSQALSTLNKLVELNLGWNDWVHDEMLGNITGACFNLETLEITFSNQFSDIGMNCLLQFQHLAHLTIFHCYLVTYEGVKTLTKLGRLQTLKFHCVNNREEGVDDLVMQLANHCRKLKLLSLLNCAEISDISIQTLARQCCLESLLLSGVKQIVDNTVGILTEYCPTLTHLDLTKSEISDNGVKVLGKLNRLEELDLSYCRNVSDDSMLELAKCCPNLKTLNIAYCRNVTMASMLAFRNNASKRKVRLCIYIPETGVRMKFEGVNKFSGSEVLVHPMLKIVFS